MDAVDVLDASADPAGGPPPPVGRSRRRGRPAPSPTVVGVRGGWPPVTVGDLVGPEDPPRRRRPTVDEAVRQGARRLAEPRPLGLVLCGLGLLIVLLFGYAYVFTGLSAERAQHQLLAGITAQNQEGAVFNLTEGLVPPQGRAVAVVEIPALHLVDAVVQGTSADDLRSGPGHMPGTPLPGQPGNAVIAGRRATYGAPFGRLGALRRGQVITVVDGWGTFRYRVTRVGVVPAGRPDVVNPTTGNVLTLVTASSAFLPEGRLAVRARLVGLPVTQGGAPTFAVPVSENGLQGDTASGFLAVAWIAVFGAVLALAAWLLRRWSQPVVVYLLTVPVLVAVALFAGQALVGFLPATV